MNNVMIRQFQDDDRSEEEKQKKHQAFLHKISYTDDPQSIHPRKYKYSSESLQPFLYFYKLLALRPCAKKHKHQLVLNIPDTIVFNDSDNPIMWFFTNQKGQVGRIDNIPYYQIISKLSEGAFEKEIVAVLKKPSYDYGGVSGNDVKVVSACELKNVLSIVLGNRSQLSVVQRFVKSNSVKASIVRTCWRVNGKHQSWSLNSNFQYTSSAKVPQLAKFIVSTKSPKYFRAVKNVSQKYTKQTLVYVKNIVDYVSRYLSIRFKEMVCDFVKDEGGNWWFINMKAFILENEGKVSLKPITSHDDESYDDDKVKKGLETYTKCRKCKYCNKIVADHLLNHKLTLMMILQCDQHLIKIGKNFPWLQRCYKQHVNTVNLYVEHKVCDSCYKLYIEIEKLMELEKKLAKQTGIRIREDNKNVVSITAIPTFKGHSPKFGSRFQKVKYDTEMPKNWGLPKDQQIKIGLENSQTKFVNRCRFMIFIHGIRDIPFEYMNTRKRYSIHYSFLNQTVKYNLNLSRAEQHEGMMKLLLNRMKVIYFFSENREKIIQFLKEEPKLFMALYQDSEKIGELNFQLDDFKSDKVIKKDFYKMFSGQKIFPYLSWGMIVSLGLFEGPQIETNSIKLIQKNNLLFPDHDYHSVDPLPIEWIEMIKEKPDDELGHSRTYSNDRSETIQTHSQFQESYQNMNSEIEHYSRRRVQSQQKVRRRAYY